MIYRRSPEFKKAFKRLPAHIQDKTQKAFILFQQNPRHPSLNVKKMEGRGPIWEGRIDDFYRFTFEYQTDENGDTVCLFRNIGRHDMLDHAP
jgi:mRNA-degrading endonuclease RelE of RelBE toxin-antitoxin system